MPLLRRPRPPGYAPARWTALVIALLGSLLVPAPGSAHTIDTSRAADAVRAEAETLGAVDRARCWRPVVERRRVRHRAICVAWWIRITRATSCTGFYEVRMAPDPSRRMTVIATFQPWCASMPAEEALVAGVASCAGIAGQVRRSPR